MNHKTILWALLVMAMIVAALMITEYTRQEEVIHPIGPMTGDEAIHTYGMEMSDMMDEMIYVPAYPGDECTHKDRVLIDTPIRIVDANGTVYWHWLYENRDNARDRNT